MAGAVRILLPASEHKRTRTRAMAIISAYDRVDVDYAPREASLSGLARSSGVTERFGRKPLLRAGSPTLRTESMTILVGRDPQKSCMPALTRLRNMAENGDPVYIAFSALEKGIWKITDLGISVVLREPRAHSPSRAEVAITFTEAPGAKVNVSPSTGGAKPTHKPTSTPPPASRTPSTRPRPPSAASPTTYTVKRGDTLSAIAGRLLGDPDRWREIASSNGIRDPRKLKVGTRLKIPRR